MTKEARTEEVSGQPSAFRWNMTFEAKQHPRHALGGFLAGTIWHMLKASEVARHNNDFLLGLASLVVSMISETLQQSQSCR